MYFKLNSGWFLCTFYCPNSGITLAMKTKNNIVSQLNISEVMF